MGYVGYVYAYFPQTFYYGANGEGIVKVFGVVRVDGEGGHLSEVFALADFFRRNIVGDEVGCFLYILRIGVGQSVFGQDSVHFGVIFAGCA